jgi:exonuclease SbcC
VKTLIHNDLLILEILNFQSHEKTVVKFAPGGQLTVITGQTDSGKTAIFRALRWLLYNQPQGTDFIRGGCTFVRVTGEFAGGHIIIRERTASKNQYRIMAPGAAAPIVLEGFGGAVPAEVQEITGVRTVTIGDMDFNLNMAEQLDGPFLGKSISSGTRAKVIGKLAGTEVLDFAGKTVGTDLFRRNQDAKRLEVEVDGLQQMVGEYDYLPALITKIEAVNRLVGSAKTNKERRDKLWTIQCQINTQNALINGCNELIDRWQFVEVAESTVAKVLDNITWAIGHKQTREKLNCIAGLIQTANNTIKRFKNVEIAEDVAAEVTGFAQKTETLSKTKNRLAAFSTAVAQCQTTIDRFKDVEQTGRVVSQVDNSLQQLNQMLKIEKNIGAIDLSIKRVNDILRGLTELDGAERLTAEAKTKVTRLEQLTNLKRSNDVIGRSVNQINATITKLTEMDKANEIQDQTVAIFEKRVKLYKLKIEISKNNTAIVDLRGSVIIHEQRVAQLEGVYKDELAALGVCPLCGAITNPLKKAG